MAYSKQGKESGNCGPCSLKMLADHYKVKNPKTGESYTVPSLNRICRVSREYGTEFKDMHRTLRRLGLEKKRLEWQQLGRSLKAKKPVLSCFLDETGIGHYAIIKGQENDQLIFHDPYFGRNFRRKKQNFHRQLKIFNHWLWEITPS